MAAVFYDYNIPNYNSDELNAYLSAAAIPGYQGLRCVGTLVQVWCDALTPTQKAQLDTLVANYVPDATYPARQRRGLAQGLLGQADPDRVLLRAVMYALLDELNTLRAQAGLPARTVAQLKNSLLTKISTGGGDS